MSATCEVCREKPASIHDYALRGGRWVAADVCADCQKRRQRTPFAILGAAAAAAALVGGGALAVEKPSRKQHPGGEPSPASPNPSPALGNLSRVFGAASTLAQYSRDLTDAARKGELDPVIGRDAEVERVVSILARRSKNNPVLIGEPGVGKTAIVEGLAQRIARGDVPQSLRDKRVLALSLGPLVAGTKYRGEFEGRVKKILDEVKRAGRDIILFIDELHTLVGRGGAEALPRRFIAHPYLPDKAIDVVDEAAATAAMRKERTVDAERVAAVVSRWTGIPQGTITDAQRAGLLALAEKLTTRVVGQDQAVRSVSEAIRRARAGLKDPRKPVGGFLFIGPSEIG